MLRFLAIASLVIGCCGPASSQNAATPTDKNTSVTPTAPPPATGMFAVSSDCISFKPPEYGPSAGAYNAIVTGVVNLRIQRSSQNAPLVVTCVSVPPAVPGVTTPIDFHSVGARVWTADESKQQWDFLRAEVRSAIQAAVNDKLVASQTIQDAATKALTDNAALRSAIVAILAEQRESIVKDVLERIKQTPQATPPAKP